MDRINKKRFNFSEEKLKSKLIKKLGLYLLLLFILGCVSVEKINVSDEASEPVDLDALMTPPNNYFNDSAPNLNINFTCGFSENNATAELSNISLYITDSNNQSFALNQVTAVSGTTNVTSWILNLNVGNYTWNCLAFNNISESRWATNKSLTLNFTTQAPPPPPALINNPPTINSIILTNDSNQNLIAQVTTSDPENDQVRTIYNWYTNNTPLLALNLPFEGGSTSGNATNNGTTRDYAFGNNATVVGATWNSSNGHDSFGYYTFNGVLHTGPYLNIPYNPNLDFTNSDYTVEIWFRTSVFNPRGVLISQGGSSNRWYIGDQDPIYGGANYSTIICKTGFSCASVYTGARAVNDNRWHHLVAVFDRNANLSLYLDGNLRDSTNISNYTNNPVNGDRSIYIGTGSGGFFRFNGGISDLRIWNKALTQQQITSLFNNGNTFIASQETSPGDIWQFRATPNDGNQDGTTQTSNTINIPGTNTQPPQNPTSSCGELTQSITLNNNVSSTRTCFTINASNVELNCNGYTINYSSSGALGYGVILQPRINNITVKNCNIIEGSSITNSKHAIFYRISSNGLIENNTIITSGLASYGIYLNNRNDNNTIRRNTIQTRGNSAFALSILGSNNNTFLQNTIITRVASSHGIYLTNSRNNSLLDNNINTLSSGAEPIRIQSNSNSNILSNNVLTSAHTSGINIIYSQFQNLSNNTIFTPRSNAIVIQSRNINENRHTITPDNLAEGLPILFNSSINNQIILENQDVSNTYGQIICAGCFNVVYNNIMVGRDGINLFNTSNSTISNSIFNSNLGDQIVTYFAHNNNIINNTLNINNPNRAFGILFSILSTNNLASNNTISTSIGNGISAIALSQTNLNTLINNTINTSGANGYGIYVVSSSNGNLIKQNNITTLGRNGAPYGIYLHSNVNDNIIESNNIRTTHSSIRMQTNVNRTRIINNNLTSTISNEIQDNAQNNYINYLIYNNSFGEIYWTQSNRSGGFLDNLLVATPGTLSHGSNLFIGNNTISLDSAAFTARGINSSANLKLYNLSLVLPIQIMRLERYSTDQIEIQTQGSNCLGTTCQIISYDQISQTLIFNTTSFSSFSVIGSNNNPPPPPPALINNPPTINSIILTNDSNQNLIAQVTTSDPENDQVRTIYNWYTNNTPLLALNLPFEGGSTSGNATNNGTTRDYSEFNNNFDVINTSFNTTAGYDGRGTYNFNGINSRLVSPQNSTAIAPLSSLSFGRKDYTVEGWIRTNNPTITQTIISQGYASNRWGVLLNNGIAQDRRLNIFFCQDQLTCTSLTSNIQLVNNWYHFVVVFDRDQNMTLYLNGTLENSTNISIFNNNPANGLTHHNTYRLNIGTALADPAASTYGLPFLGNIDEIRIWNKALTQQQITSLFNNGNTFIASQETSPGDIWQFRATPNDGNQDGTTQTSNAINVTTSINNTTILISISQPSGGGGGGGGGGSGGSEIVTPTENIIFNNNDESNNKEETTDSKSNRTENTQIRSNSNSKVGFNGTEAGTNKANIKRYNLEFVFFFIGLFLITFLIYVSIYLFSKKRKEKGTIVEQQSNISKLSYVSIVLVGAMAIPFFIFNSIDLLGLTGNAVIQNILDGEKQISMKGILISLGGLITLASLIIILSIRNYYKD